MNKFLIIDGSSMLTTNYFATLPRSIKFAKTDEEKAQHYHEIMHTTDGTFTNAIYGTLKMLHKILLKQQPTHIAVVFDQTRDTFRRKLYSDYKAQRKATQEPLREQFMLIEQLLPEMGIKTFYSPDYEADDFAGSIAKKFESPDTRVYLLTKDHDYLQLVSDYTRCWMLQSNKDKAEELYQKYYYPYGITQEDINLPDNVFEFTPNLVKDEFGLEPVQIIDMKAIGGDTSDNIPGVKGVSDTTATLLLQEYSTVESLYTIINSIDLSNKSEIKEFNDFLKTLGISRSPLNMLRKTDGAELVGEQAALLSKKLATIKCDIPLSCTLEDFTTNVNMDKFRAICTRLEIKSIFRK